MIPASKYEELSIMGVMEKHAWRFADAGDSPTSYALPTRKDRFTSLDALRGIAASGVVATHVLQLGFPSLVLNHSLFRMLVNGRCFVIFFFLLSGFVLSISLLRAHPLRSYPNYLLRRVVRIYLPYCVAGLIAVGVAQYTHVSVGLRAILDHFLLVGTSAGIDLNNPSWSLIYEMRISIILPLMCWAFLRHRRAFWIGMLAVAIAEEAGIVGLGIGQFPYSSETLLGAMTITARYTLCFAVGMWLAFSVLSQSSWLTRVRGLMVPLLGAFAFVLMSVLLDYTSLIGGAVVLVLALRSSVLKRVLSLPVLAWLGRVSYSLYLTHVLVLAVTMTALHDVATPGFAALIGSAIALLFAEVFYRAVEATSIFLAKSLKIKNIKTELAAEPAWAGSKFGETASTGHRMKLNFNARGTSVTRSSAQP